MVAGDAEAVEVVGVPLDLWALDDIETHLAEGALHCAAGEGDGVQVAARARAGGECDVDGGGGESGGGGAVELLPARLERGLEGGLEVVGGLAGGGALSLGEITNAAQDGGQVALAAEIRRAPGVEGACILGGVELAVGVRLEAGDVGHGHERHRTNGPARGQRGPNAGGPWGAATLAPISPRTKERPSRWP